MLVARALAIVMVAAAAAHGDATDRCIAESESGQRLLLTRHFVEAKPHLVACAAATCPAPIARDCAERVQQADASIASVIAVAELAGGGDAPDARVSVDGAPVVQGEPVSLDPGPHRFEFERAGERVAETVDIEAGARERRVVGTFAPAVQVRTRHALAAELTGATGIAAIVAGGVLGGLARADRDRERTDCATAADCADYAAAQRDYRAAQTDATASTICAAVGGALVAAGIAAWFVWHEHGVAIAPAPNGVAVRGRF